MQVTVIASFKAKNGFAQLLKTELLKLIAPGIQEEGCISYDLHQSLDDPGLFLFHENWRSRDDLDRHLEMPYIRELLRRTENMLAQPISVQLFERIG
jgi:quinol monooxygenase YgiN